MNRDELKDAGHLLSGPIVPDWFKLLCDGCSVPTGILKYLTMSEQCVAACRIHDWRYYCIAISYKPGNPLREQWRILADYELRLNIRQSFNRPMLGRLFGRIYYRGVRLGGSYALRDENEILERIPQSLGNLAELTNHLKKNYDDSDNLFRNMILRSYSRNLFKKNGEHCHD